MQDRAGGTPGWRNLLYVGLVGCVISVAWFLLFSMAAVNATPTPGLSERAIVYVNPLCIIQNFTADCRGGMSYLGRHTSFPTYSPYILWISIVVVGISLAMRRRK